MVDWFIHDFGRNPFYIKNFPLATNVYCRHDFQVDTATLTGQTDDPTKDMPWLGVAHKLHRTVSFHEPAKAAQREQ